MLKPLNTALTSNPKPTISTGLAFSSKPIEAPGVAEPDSSDKKSESAKSLIGKAIPTLASRFTFLNLYESTVSGIDSCSNT